MDEEMDWLRRSISPRERCPPMSPTSEGRISYVIESSFLDAIDKAGGCPDLLVKSGTHEWKVHRKLLCSKSSYFERTCNPGGEEWFDTAYESESDEREDLARLDKEEVNLDEEEHPDIITRMLISCYNVDYYGHAGNETNEQQSPGKKALIDAKVHIIARRYGFEDLEYQACSRLSRNLAKALESLSENEEQRDEVYLVTDAIRLAFTTHGGPAQRSVLDTLRNYHQLLLGLQPFQQLVREGGTFAFSILEIWTDAINKREVVCNKCSFKPKYHYATTKQDLECSCCTKKFGAFLRFPNLK